MYEPPTRCCVQVIDYTGRPAQWVELQVTTPERPGFVYNGISNEHGFFPMFALDREVREFNFLTFPIPFPRLEVRCEERLNFRFRQGLLRPIPLVADCVLTAVPLPYDMRNITLVRTLSPTMWYVEHDTSWPPSAGDTIPEDLVYTIRQMKDALFLEMIGGIERHQPDSLRWMNIPLFRSNRIFANRIVGRQWWLFPDGRAVEVQ